MSAPFRDNDDFGMPQPRRRVITWKRAWQVYRLESIFVTALLITILLGGFATHPGVHLFGTMLLLDVLVWIRHRRWSRFQAVFMLVLNLVGILVILVGSDPTELWVSGLYGIFAFLLLIESKWLRP